MNSRRVLPRSACFVEIFSLPRLKDHEIAELVAEHARTEVPITFEEVETDFVIRPRGSTVEVLAAFAPRNLVEELRGAGGQQLILSSEILSRASGDGELSLYIADGWGEVLRRTEQGATSDAFRWSSEAELRQRLADLLEVPHSGGLAISTLEHLPEGLLPPSMDLLDETAAIRRYGKRCQPLFEGYRRRRKARSQTRALVPASLLLLFLLAFGHSSLEGRRRELERLGGRLEVAQRATARAQELVGEISSLREDLAQARRSGLALPGSVLGPLIQAMPAGVQIQSITIDEAGALLQGSSGLPFDVIEEIQALPLVADTELLSLERLDAGGRFRFSLRLDFDGSAIGGGL